MITEEGYGAMFRKLIISADYGSKLGTQTNLDWMLECRWYFEMDSFDSLYEQWTEGEEHDRDACVCQTLVSSKPGDYSNVI